MKKKPLNHKKTKAKKSKNGAAYAARCKKPEYLDKLTPMQKFMLAMRIR